ncbi:hypothetical protein A3765_28825, partial [Oleiphilus sp. HI0130]
TNKFSNLELSAKYGPSESAIRRRAKHYKWERDLAKGVQSRTKEKLIREGAIEADLSEDQIVEEVATRNASVIKTHRDDIKKGRDICALLMDELKDTTANYMTLAELVEKMAKDEEWQPQKRAAVERAISLPQRSGVLRDLANSMKTLQGIERTAYGIDGKEDDRDALDELLEVVSDTSRGVDGYA